MGTMVSHLEEPSHATDTFVVAATVARRIDEPQLEALALGDLAHNRAQMGDLEEARALYDDALTTLGDQAPWLQGHVLSGLADVARRQGNMGLAGELGTEALECLRAGGLRESAAECEGLRGDLARYRGDSVDAERHYREAKQLFDAKGSPIAGHIECRLAPLLVESGRYEEAQKRMVDILKHRITGHCGITPFLARTTLLVCAAQAKNWLLWNRHVQRLEPLFSCRLVDPSIAELASMAASSARDQGAPEHAAQAWRLAHLQYSALGRHEDALAVKQAWQKG
jgi:hypothetical protein